LLLLRRLTFLRPFDLFLLSAFQPRFWHITAGSYRPTWVDDPEIPSCRIPVKPISDLLRF